MRNSFNHKLNLDTEWVILRRLAILSGVQPVYFHCCINSCIAYTEKYQHHDSCPFCNESRYGPQSKPRRLFSYIPIIPRLQGFYQNVETIKKLSYRAHLPHVPGVIRDVFDSQNYRNLLKKNVVVDGVTRPYTYFCDKRDLAFSLCVDGYLLFKRRRGGPSATPILVQNYNLPPQIRTHIGNLICLGIIPPPRGPKDIHSFLAPFDEELAQLAIGIPTFDASQQSVFDLRAYVILKMGDIVAMDKLLGIKGVNAVSPCRSCKIKGVRKINTGGTNYYVPLVTPVNSVSDRPSIDPRNLVYRKHKDFDAVLRQMEAAPTAKLRAEISKKHGIREAPALRRVCSIDYARSCPYELMHLVFENIIPNKVKLWTGKFPGIAPGSDFEFTKDDWEAIGEETADAIRHIPAAFVRVLGNIADERSTFTAESWSFWFIYLAPHLLKGRFNDNKYYKHMLGLVRILRTLLKFEITAAEVDELEVWIVDWVETFER